MRVEVALLICFGLLVTLVHCESPPEIFPIEKCLDGKASGNCRARLVRYYFDNKKNKCRKFTYSGCGGNDNNFTSKKDCEKACIVPF